MARKIAALEISISCKMGEMMAMQHSPDCPCDRCQKRTWVGSGTPEDPYTSVDNWYDEHLADAGVAEGLEALGEAAAKVKDTFEKMNEATQELQDLVAEQDRQLLADCLGCAPDLIDDVVAVWAKR